MWDLLNYTGCILMLELEGDELGKRTALREYIMVEIL
jgi:hypothetical protein